jgi:ligand-binding SRPBCC domain-containing protein
MRTFDFERSITLPFPQERVFDFFARAENLELLTPPWLSFRILTPQPIRMGEGALIDYRLRLHGIPLRWRSEITIWEPPHRFVDAQRRGPYRLWVHEHRFTEVDGGTRVEDRVQYAVLGGTLIDKLLVAPDVKRIFDFRQERLRALFPTSRDGHPGGVSAPEGEGVA